MTTRFSKSRTSLPVRDVTGSIDFYRRTLGFEVVDRCVNFRKRLAGARNGGNTDETAEGGGTG